MCQAELRVAPCGSGSQPEQDAGGASVVRHWSRWPEVDGQPRPDVHSGQILQHLGQVAQTQSAVDGSRRGQFNVAGEAIYSFLLFNVFLSDE